jgi:hypothetical protein
MNEYLGMDILEYGNNHHIFRVAELETHLRNKGYDWGNPQVPNLLGGFLSEYFVSVGIPQEQTRMMRLSGHLQLLDYIELREARQSAKDAKRDALNAMKITKWSLILSAGLTVISIIIAIQANNITAGQTISNKEKSENSFNESLALQLQRESIKLQKKNIAKTDSLIKIENGILKKIKK